MSDEYKQFIVKCKTYSIAGVQFPSKNMYFGWDMIIIKHSLLEVCLQSRVIQMDNGTASG